MANWLSEVELSGDVVTLEPLRKEHVEGLKEAVLDGEWWKLWYAAVPSPDQMEKYVDDAISAAKLGNIAYAVRQKSTGKIVGSTRFYKVDNINKRAMLGYTWYSKSVCGTSINPECKYMMFKHLFETNKAIAVEFRTHFFNKASRKGIENLGAKLDGIIRSHIVMRDGSIRDTAMYSIIASEWPSVKNELLSRLES